MRAGFAHLSCPSHLQSIQSAHWPLRNCENWPRPPCKNGALVCAFFFNIRHHFCTATLAKFFCPVPRSRGPRSCFFGRVLRAKMVPQFVLFLPRPPCKNGASVRAFLPRPPCKNGALVRAFLPRPPCSLLVQELADAPSKHSILSKNISDCFFFFSLQASLGQASHQKQQDSQDSHQKKQNSL